MDDYDNLSVYKVDETPTVKEIRVFRKYQQQGESKGEKREKDKKRDNFKDEFFDYFGLDREMFSVNLIKDMDGKWKIEICHKKSGRCIYQDYATVCGIMDKRCRLPDNLVGYNVNVRV